MPEDLEIELDDIEHRYRLNGCEVPGCTTILTAMGAVPGFNFLSAGDRKFYQSRGHAVHRATELTICNTIDRRTLSADTKPYLVGWEKFCKDYGVRVLEYNGRPFVEIALGHPLYRYGVKPDVVAEVTRFKDSGVIELKATSAHAPATALQLASQLLAVRHVMPSIGKLRLGLRLLPEAPYYDLKRYTDPSDEGVWLSLLNSYHWLAKNKLLSRKSQ
jgi:hypothetical protein